MKKSLLTLVFTLLFLPVCLIAQEAEKQNYSQTKSIAKGKPSSENLYRFQKKHNTNTKALPGSVAAPWVERGPTNVGGRTRAILWDLTDPSGKKVFAGGVSGGLWYNNDITSADSIWRPVNDFWANLSVSCITHDPTNLNTIYVGTGDGFSPNGPKGNGIWKSINGGNTWLHLTATDNKNFKTVQKIIVRSNGDILAATTGDTCNTGGIMYSENGGTQWAQYFEGNLMNCPNSASDIVETSSGTLFASFGLSGNDGIYSSLDGLAWTMARASNTNEKRINLAVSESNANVVYALVENDEVGGVPKIIKTTLAITNPDVWEEMPNPSWINSCKQQPEDDWTGGKAWHNLAIGVDPTDENSLLIGGVDLFKSSDGANNWIQISDWAGNCGTQYVHSGQHDILYKSNSSSDVLFCNDGGVYYSNTAQLTEPVILARNSNYNVTQFNACAMHPDSARDYYLAGSQDNGTQQFTEQGKASTNLISGTSGAYCFIDEDDTLVQIASHNYNNYVITRNGWGDTSSVQLGKTGNYVNPCDYDSYQNHLFTAFKNDKIYRIKINPTFGNIVDELTIEGLSDTVTHIKVSNLTTDSTTLYIGTNKGRVFKVTNAEASSFPEVFEITGSLPSGSISCIDIGANENELLVTYSNYEQTSVFYTKNGGLNWIDKEGNLPDMPIHWALFNPNFSSEVILATESGIYGTTQLLNSSPTWQTKNDGLANCRVNMLKLRKSDGQIAAATYGRGLFTSKGFILTDKPQTNFTASKTEVCPSDTVYFTDKTLYQPNDWKWVITPDTGGYTFITPDSIRNPIAVFTIGGNYNVKLVTTNPIGKDSILKIDFIVVDSLKTPSFTVISNNSEICEGEEIIFSKNNEQNTDNGSPTYYWYINKTIIASSSIFKTTALTPGDTVFGAILLKTGCLAGVFNFAENFMTPIVHQAPPVTVELANDLLCLDTSFTLTGGLPLGGKYSGTNITDNKFNPLSPNIVQTGSYKVFYSTFDSLSGCYNSASDTLFYSSKPDTLKLKQVNDVVYINDTIFTNNGFLFVENVCEKLEWYYNDTLIPNYNEPYKQVTNTGYYYARCYNTAGCYSQTELTSYFLSVSDYGNLSEVTIAPVPCNESLNILHSLGNQVEFTVFDAVGRDISGLKFHSIDGGTQLITKNIPAGLFLIKIAKDDLILMKRFVVHH